MTTRWCALAAALTLGFAGLLEAQPLGTFRWQQLPYCNVFTLNVVQVGSFYTLDGIDDQCGAARAASVLGTAFLNPNGTIGFGLNVVTAPGGTPVHVDAVLNLPSISGTWTDSTGATGAFAFTPGPAAAGSPRPAPRLAFPAGLSLNGATITGLGAPASATDAATRGYVDAAVAPLAATADVRAALIGEKVWKGSVSSNGTKNSTGPYTTSRVSIGNYSFQFDVTGLGIPSSVGFPIVVAAAAGLSSVTTTVFTRSLTISGGVVTRVGTQILTFDAAGNAVDSTVLVLLTMPDPDTGSPVPPLLRDDPRVTCVTQGPETTCTYTEGSPLPRP